MQRTPCSEKRQPQVPPPQLYGQLKTSAISSTASSLLLTQRKANALTVYSLEGSQKKTLESKQQICSFRKRHSRTRIPSVVTSESTPANSSVKSAPAKQERCFCKNAMMPFPAAGSSKDWFAPPTQELLIFREQRKNKQIKNKAFILYKHFYKIQDSNTLSAAANYSCVRNPRALQSTMHSD